VKPHDEADEEWKAHPERKTRHYVFVLDVTESMAACMEARRSGSVISAAPNVQTDVILPDHYLRR
jgi:hypothetical protein